MLTPVFELDPSAHTSAIMVPCYNRPQYLKPVLTALSETIQVKNGMPVVLICDGGSNATQEENLSILKSSAIPVVQCMFQTEWVGLGRNIHCGNTYMFEDCSFDNVFFVEEDIIVSSHALTLLSNLLAWCQLHYDNVEIVGAPCFCLLPREDKRKRLKEVGSWGDVLAVHLKTKKCWLAVKPVMDYYVENFLRTVSYEKRPHAAIVTWMKELGSKMVKRSEPRLFKPFWHWQNWFENHSISSQDCALSLAIHLVG